MSDPTKTETAFGGATASVTLKSGATETVTIKQIAIEDCPTLMALLDSELGQIEFYCGKAKGWAETLAPASQELVLAEGDRINADFFARWHQRKMLRQEQLNPGLTEKMVTRLLDKALPTGLPKPPQS